MPSAVRPFNQFIEEQTGTVRHEVEEIKNQLTSMDSQLEKSRRCEGELSRKLEAVICAQASLKDRVQEVSRKMTAYKSLLASFHS